MFTARYELDVDSNGKKDKVFAVCIIKPCRGSKGTAPFVFNYRYYKQASGYIHAPASLSSEGMHISLCTEGMADPRVGPEVLKKKTVSSPYTDSNPGPSNPLAQSLNRFTDL